MQSMVHGFSTAIWWSFGILVAASAIAFVLINTGHQGGSPTGAGAKDEDANHIPVLAH